MRAERTFENHIQIAAIDATLKENISSAVLQCLCCSSIIKRWKSMLAIIREDRSPEEDASRKEDRLRNLIIPAYWKKKKFRSTFRYIPVNR